MNILVSFLRLIRWPNLFFIALTQMLFFYCALPFAYSNSIPSPRVLSQPGFYLLMLSSVLIAAAGYIINDYFDLNIDLINKPEKIIVDRFIKRRIAILLHIALSLVGFLISAWVGYTIHNAYIPTFNAVAIILLWLYSTTFKKELIIGNVIISLLTAWVILVIMVAENPPGFPGFSSVNTPRLLRVSFLYGGFAFIISLIREVIKDMEDMQGDLKYGCRTMPIIWGIPVSKVFSAVWIAVLAGAVLVVTFYVWTIGWWISSLYSIIFIMIPLIRVLKKLYAAQTATDYHELSGMVKFIMLTGILSIIFFRVYSST